MKYLNPEILSEINRRIQRYKSFETSNLREKGLEEIMDLDIGWISRVCISDAERAKPYLDYYEGKLNEPTRTK